MRYRFVSLGLVVGVAMFAGSAPVRAEGVPTEAAAGPGSFQAGYLTPVLAASVGSTLSYFVNGDIAPHDVTSVARNAGGGPLFASATVGLGGVAQIFGLENLAAASLYEFFCSVHPGTMRGTLVALPGA